MRRLLAVVLLLASCSGCALPSLVPPDQAPYPLVAHAHSMKPYPMYRIFWAMAQDCSRESGAFNHVRFEDIHFFWVEGWFIPLPDQPHHIDGLTWPDLQHGRMEIYLPESVLMDRNTIVHEMLHVLGYGHSKQLMVNQCHVMTEAQWAYQQQPEP